MNDKLDDKCPFCGEPIVHENGYYSRWRCGTQGPDINGEYDVGHTCDIRTWTRLLIEKDAEIERLKCAHHHLAPTWLCPDCQDQWNASESMQKGFDADDKDDDLK